MADIKVENIDLTCNKTSILHDISMSFASGEITCLLGKSGSGKTSLLKSIAGLLDPCKGSILIDDKICFSKEKSVNISPYTRKVGLMLQDYGLFPHLNVKKNILFGLDKKSPDFKEYKSWILEKTKDLEIDNLLHKMPYTLSGGEQQRVALLRALSIKPRVLLLDEPFSALSPLLKSKVRTEIINFIRSLNITTIVVTHDKEEALLIADKIALIEDGKLIKHYKPCSIGNIENCACVVN